MENPSPSADSKASGWRIWVSKCSAKKTPPKKLLDVLVIYNLCHGSNNNKAGLHGMDDERTFFI